MDKNDIVQVLKELLSQIEHLEAVEIRLKEAQDKLTSLQCKPLSAVNNFDAVEKNKYITSRIGQAPDRPKGAIKFAVPVYLSKKKAYEKEYADYMIRFKEAERKYYIEFKDTREKLESEEKASAAVQIQLAEQVVAKLECDYQLSATALNNNEIVSAKLKEKKIINALIEYFQDQRVDDIKEAVNLYFEEEHRKRLEAFAEEQVRLTAEVADSAEEAIRRADDAMAKAEEACRRADDAYNEAQSAYWAATSGK